MTAVERVGLDRIDDLAGPSALRDQRRNSDRKAAKQRHKKHTQPIEPDAGRQAIPGRQIEVHTMQNIDHTTQGGDKRTDDASQRRPDENLDRLVRAPLSAVGNNAPLQRVQNRKRRSNAATGRRDHGPQKQAHEILAGAPEDDRCVKNGSQAADCSATFPRDFPATKYDKAAASPKIVTTMSA